MKEMKIRQARLCMLALAIAAALALGLPGMDASGAPEYAPAAAIEQKILIPGGKALGITIETEGLILVGTSDLGSTASPARIAGLKPGDVITMVENQPVRRAEDIAALLRAGKSASISVVRDDETRTVTITPAADPRDGTARIGAWVRSSTAGVGTLTYIDPQTGEFGALGHAIADVDTGILLPVEEGGIYESDIVQINKGKKGAPGELVGDFLMDEVQIGTITENNSTGVYGIYSGADVSDLPYPSGLPVARWDELRTGPAQILATLNDEVKAYNVEIEHIDHDGAYKLRSIVIHVTDPELLESTGGIVQGMSGSPIIQDGKLVGAVTHVLVNDPSRGYGIFIENMLNAAG